MEKSGRGISTDYSLSSHRISGTFTHITSLSLHKNYDRHICPHFVGELQMGQVTKGGRGVVSSAGLGLCALRPAASTRQVPGVLPSAGVEEWGQLALCLLLVH